MSNLKFQNRHAVLAIAKFTSFSVMPLNENESFHKQTRKISTTKPKTRTFISENETSKAQKRNTESTENETPKANINDCTHIGKRGFV